MKGGVWVCLGGGWGRGGPRSAHQTECLLRATLKSGGEGRGHCRCNRGFTPSIRLLSRGKDLCCPQCEDLFWAVDQDTGLDEGGVQWVSGVDERTHIAEEPQRWHGSGNIVLKK